MTNMRNISHEEYDVIVLGAGAAGLMSAITAAKRSKRILVLEKSNKVGKKIKKVNDGIIINKVELDNSIIFCVFFVSQYSQIKAKNVVKGIETNNPAKSDERFATSATSTTTVAVIKILIIKYNMFFLIFSKHRHN